MGDVIEASLRLPTAIFTVLIGVCLLLWLASSVGIIDTESEGGAGEADDSWLGEALEPIGLAEVPLLVVLAIVAVFGWAASVVIDLAVVESAESTVAVLLGVASVAVCFVIGLLVARAAAPLLRPVFQTATAHRAADLVGRVAEVRSAAVNAVSGYGDVRGPDGNLARVELRIRPDSATNREFLLGHRVLVVDYDGGSNVYIVDELPHELADPDST
jgi:Protein of unknown function (DUF1449)